MSENTPLGPSVSERLGPFFAALWDRHTARVRPADIGRGARALRAHYIERNRGFGRAVSSGRGKQAAFAVLYAPLHLLQVAQVIEQAQLPAARMIVDVGCGTGIASAAWALTRPGRSTRLLGLDIDPFALGEAAWNWRYFGLDGQVRRMSLGSPFSVPSGAAIVAAFCLNELEPAVQTAAIRRLLAAQAKGSPVVIVEPVARGVAPFWPALEALARQRGGQVREHRLRPELPPLLARLRRQISASTELACRSLVLPGRDSSGSP